MFANPVIANTTSESSSSPPRSSPLSSIVLGPLPSTHPRLASGPVQAHPLPIHMSSPLITRKSPSFRIYEDTIEDELAREASKPVPTVEYPHDNKENPAEDASPEGDANVQEEPTVHVGERFDESRIDAVLEAAVEYLAPSMFDGISDETGYNRHIAPSRPVTRCEASNDERDSVLGTPTPTPP
jgi:hypothetical protein